MSTDNQPGVLDHPRLLAAHADLLVDIGGVDGSFQWSDVQGNDAALRKFRRSSMVHVEHVENGRRDKERYTLKEPAREYLEQHLETRTTFCPCGHGGIVNRGDYYVCGFDGCDERFAREEVTDD